MRGAGGGHLGCTLSTVEGSMNFPIDAREAEALLQALDNYLPELEYELARVKLERDRHELVRRDQLLRELRARLDALLRPTTAR